MAARAGVSSSTVQRIWSARGLAPDRVQTFKLSGDPDFEKKLVDVVGLYLNPPENAIVLCRDEKSQIQALDRTQPSLPIKPGRAGTPRITNTPSRSPGQPPPIRSSTRSAAEESHSMQSPPKTGTHH